MALQKQINEKKFKTCWFGLAKCYWPNILADDVGVDKRFIKLDAIVEWQGILINLGGLLLVIFTCLCTNFSFMCGVGNK